MKIKSLFGLIVFTPALLAMSCGNRGNNELQTSEAQQAASSQGTKLSVDVNKSHIYWKGFKPAGSHHGMLGIKSGELFIEGDELKAGSFVLDMNHIICEDLTDQSMNEKLVGHLKSPDFFDVAAYPEGKFTITKVEKLSDNPEQMTHRISGNLQLKGIDKNITFDIKASKQDNTYYATTSAFTINRTQWGVNYQSKSIFKNLTDSFINDDIEINIHIVTQ